MSTWLDPLRAALDAAPAPVDFFLRDDDAGWFNERLFALLDVVARHRLPLDLAVIPRALGPELARSLAWRASEGEAPLGLHQHGLAHTSHHADVRKCEFGPSRDRASQLRDLLEGRELLDAWLPGFTQPVFTPPWNRCIRSTAEALSELGFEVLSRHISAPAFGVAGLVEMPVSVDWSYAKRDQRRLTFDELGGLVAEQLASGAPVGVNLHHAVMDDNELRRLDQLCGLLAAHESARCRPLYAIAAELRRPPSAARGRIGARSAPTPW